MLNLDELPDVVLIHCERSGQDIKVKVVDDGFAGDKLWVCGHEYGPTHLIRADSFESAYEAWVDEQPTISADEVHEAYGAWDKLVEHLESNGHENTRHLRDFANRWAGVFFNVSTHNANYTDAWDGWELVEGYQYQANATGTGIVDVGHYEWMNDLCDTSYTLVDSSCVGS